MAGDAPPPDILRPNKELAIQYPCTTTVNAETIREDVQYIFYAANFIKVYATSLHPKYILMVL
jgi:hypothetical protein